MTPNQTNVLDALKRSDDWIMVSQLAKMTGIKYQIVYKTLESPVFKDLEIGYQPMKVMNRQMDVKMYRIKRQRSNSSEALKLAKKHIGMFGQLYWGSNA